MSTLYIGGDKFITMGTVKEISEYMGLNERSIYFYMSPAYKRRLKGYRDSYIIIKLGRVTNE